MRRLIVNADDFGLSPGVNRGIIAGHQRGIVTSASLMVRSKHAAVAAEYARRHPALSVGLHIDLGEWEYRKCEWVMLYEIVRATNAAAVAAEVDAQLATFRRLVGRDPTHLDSHQHVHQDEPVRSIVDRVGRALSVPVRGLSSEIRYCGSFYGQTAEGEPLPGLLQTDALIGILRELPDGLTELACHPAEADDAGSTYGAERLAELAALCNPRVRAVIDELQIHLVPVSATSATARR